MKDFIPFKEEIPAGKRKPRIDWKARLAKIIELNVTYCIGTWNNCSSASRYRGILNQNAGFKNFKFDSWSSIVEGKSKLYARRIK